MYRCPKMEDLVAFSDGEGYESISLRIEGEHNKPFCKNPLTRFAGAPPGGGAFRVTTVTKSLSLWESWHPKRDGEGSPRGNDQQQIPRRLIHI